MRGLIYKNIAVFFKSIELKFYIIAAAGILLCLYDAGIYGGLLASVMLAMVVGVQNIMGIASDEKAGWEEYQSALPLKGSVVVASRYAAALCTLLVSMVGSLILNLLASLVYQSFHAAIWECSIAVSVIIPIFWTGVYLPLTYWFGFSVAQMMGVLAVIPIFYFVKYFEDGPGFAAMVSSIPKGIAVACVLAVLLFAVSMGVSILGYGRKRN